MDNIFCNAMYKVTVTKGGYIVAVYYNENKDSALWQARVKHGSKCQYEIELIK